MKKHWEYFRKRQAIPLTPALTPPLTPPLIPPPPTYTNTETITYTNTVNGEVVTSSKNKITRYTVTTMVDGVEQTGTIVDDGIMLTYDDGLGVMSYLIPGDGQELFIQETISPEGVDCSDDRPLTIKAFDGYIDVGNDGSLIDPNRRPVFITHGFCGSYEQMLTLKEKYDLNKYQVFFVDYGSYWGIDDIAAALADKINNDFWPFYPDKISPVFEQHSMGATTVYYLFAKRLIDMAKIESALMISIAPLHGSYGKPEYFNFLLGFFYSQAFADGNTAALFDDLERMGLPPYVTLFIIGTRNDKTNSTAQQLGFPYDGYIDLPGGHTEILTDPAVGRIFDLYVNYSGTFIQKIGNWNISYENGKRTALYYDDFYGPGEGVAFLADDTGDLAGICYAGSYLDGNTDGLIFVDENYFLITYNSDGSWDQETMFGSMHFDSAGIAIGYTITTGLAEGVDALIITLNDTEQTATVLYKRASLLSSANQAPVLAAIGDKSVNAGSNLAFTISATDPDGDALTYSASGLPAGDTFNAGTRAFSWTPTSSQVGSYNVTFTVWDGSRSDTETITITVANIVISNAPPPTAPGTPKAPSPNNGTFTVTWTASTDGSGIAYYQVYRGEATGDMSLITTVTTNSYNESNLAVGKYRYIVVAIDGTGQNSQSPTSAVIEVVLVDLVMTAVSGPSSAVTGTTISITDTVKNQGPVSPGNFYTGFYLSTDAVITTTDRRIGMRGISSLATGASNSATTIVTVPTTLAAGTYYIGAIADYFNTVKESNETNNALTGQPITISADPDLVMTAVSGPTWAVRGMSVSISNTIKNQWVGKATNSSSVGLYLSKDSVITTADTLIGTRTISGLAAGASNSATTIVTVPTTLAAGIYYIGAIADYANTVKESNGSNNARAGNTIVMR